jgi:Spy/CpxP family protein refolding chaperone
MIPLSPRWLLILAAILPLSLRAQEAPPAPDAALLQRAEKIVGALELADAAQAARIRHIVAGQYAALRPVHDAREASIRTARDRADADQAGTEAAVQTARDIASARQAELHYAFLARLAAELTPTQVEQIKDGMTYGVLPNTYRVYQEMLPALTSAQRVQILAWLAEAREHAMDAGSAQEKHAWFGKYKGRINNYLSKAGYDMKQAERDLFARKKAADKATE